MDLTYTDEQKLLAESVERFVRQNYSSEARRKILVNPEGFSRELWAEFAELGWLALPFSEADGGLGGGSVEVGVLMEAFGRGLVAEPYISTVILGGGLVAAIGTPSQRAGILPQIVEGKLLLAFAHAERQGRASLTDVATAARRAGAGWVLDGEKIAVLDAPSADRLLVTARISGARTAREGIGVFIVPRDAAGLTLEGYPRLGGGRAANIRLKGVEVPAEALLGGSEDALPAIEAAVDKAISAMTAEAVGMMSALIEQTAAYTKTREQFGRPLAFNQAVRHRLADMATALEEGRSISLRAALLADAEPEARTRAASAAKVKIGRGARFCAEQAVQLHGGMGVTEELEIGAYFQRILAFETIFGGVDHHLRRHAAASGRTAARAA